MNYIYDEHEPYTARTPAPSQTKPALCACDNPYSHSHNVGGAAPHDEPGPYPLSGLYFPDEAA